MVVALDGFVGERRWPGKASPHTVLEVLLKPHCMQHTARAKSVSFKTRHERANFLRHFFRELESRGGFKIAPDPRNLGQRHIPAAVDLWRKDGLKPSTIQTYRSFLRGLAGWLGKPGFIRRPACYGLEVAGYQRSGIDERDRRWSAQGVDVDGLIDKVAAFDPCVGSMLRLIRAFGLRKREAIMFRPNECLVAIGIPVTDRRCAPGVALVTGHAKPGGQGPDWAALARSGLTLVVYMGTQRVAEIVEPLRAAGLGDETPVAVDSAAHTARQRHARCTLGSLVRTLNDEPQLGSPAVPVIGEVAALGVDAAVRACDTGEPDRRQGHRATGG